MTNAIHDAPKTTTAAPFDAYAASYNDVLNAALAATGETKEYFAAGRLKCLATLLAKHRVQARYVLDYGCGTGTSTPLFFDLLACREAVCIDVSRASLEIAARDHRDLAARFDLVDRHEPSADIDVAYSNGVFHHIAPDARRAALSHIHRSLRDDGVFALCENNPWNPGTRHCMRVNPLDREAAAISPRSARRLLKSAGFAILEFRHLFFFPRRLAALRDLEPYLSRMPVGGQYLVLARKSPSKGEYGSTSLTGDARLDADDASRLRLPWRVGRLPSRRRTDS